MYVQGFVVPVPAGNQQAYVAAAAQGWEYFRKLGAVEHMEAWEEDVRDGQQTDMRMAVKAKEGEIIAFSWVIWPDKVTCDAAEAKMREGMADELGEMPFDGSRMIFGGFAPVFHEKA